MHVCLRLILSPNLAHSWYKHGTAHGILNDALELQEYWGLKALGR